MAKKKKKRGAAAWGILKWIVIAGGGAVVGAYSIRWVDRKFAKGGAQPDEGDTPAVEEPPGATPMSNPLAVQAISPLVPIAVPIPMMQPAPLIASPPAMSPGHMFAPSAASNPEPAPPSPGEVRRNREEACEDLVKRFEEGTLG